MEMIAKPKKWGNSIGVIIPKEIINRQKITLKDQLVIHVEKSKDIEKNKLLAEGYIEMRDELIKLNKEFEKADAKWPRK